METELLVDFEQAILDRREQLRGEVLDHLNGIEDSAMTELHGQVHDSGEESIADMLADVSIASLEQQSREIAALESALARIRSGRYGVCVDCEIDIEIERLRANPAAERCYDCQAKKEDNRSSKDSTPSL